MDPSEFFALGKPSPRREGVQLQGPRPAPLKVNKDSFKIKKPPVAPGRGPSQFQLSAPAPAPAPPQRAREPVIIYTVSPKVIHTDPRDFMSLVQRLTGASPTALSGQANAGGCASPITPAGAISPAARLATIERAGQTAAGPYRSAVISTPDDFVAQFLDVGGGAAALDRSGSLPGILSPLPSALPAFSPGIFSPMVDPSSLSFLNEMSPVFRANNGGPAGNIFGDGGPFIPSPGNFFSTPVLPSPGAFWDFFSPL